MKRLLILSLFALLLVPAAAGATLPKPDTFVAVSHENGPASAPAAPAATPPSVIRTITTTDGGSDNTLAIVLASAALGIALGGTAYMTFRLRPQHRSS